LANAPIFLNPRKRGLNQVSDLANLIPSIAALAAALAAMYAAYQSKRSVQEQAALRRAELQPVLGVTDVEPTINFVVGHRYYPALVHFTNLGKGSARVLVVESNRRDIEVEIGSPISVGSNSSTAITLLLNTQNESMSMSLYYWDIEDHCYRTEVTLHLKLFFDDEEPIARWRADVDRTVTVKNKKPPPKVLNWPREEFFGDDWW
jgi:hypothetical protein